MATIKPILHYRADASGRFPIKIRITHDKQSVYVPMGFSVKKSEWNKKADHDRKVRASHYDHVALNRSILDRVVEIKQIATAMPQHTMSAKAVRDIAMGKVTMESNDGTFAMRKATEFFSFVEDSIEGLFKANRVSNAKSTGTMLSKVREFWAIRSSTIHERELDKDRLPFREITVNFLKHFESYMLGSGLRQTTVAKNFARLRRMLNEAIAEGHMGHEDYPFRRFKIKHGKPGRKTKLSVEELRLLFAYPAKAGSRSLDVLNIFKFQFYVGGMRIGDCLQLRWRNVQGDRLAYAMEKTDQPTVIRIEAQAGEVLAHYRGTETHPDDFIFPFLDNATDYSDVRFLKRQISAKTALINKYLKAMARKIGIEKTVTTHVARHSMADYLRRNKVDIIAIQNILRHSNVKTTAGYLASLDQEAVDDSIGLLSEV